MAITLFASERYDHAFKRDIAYFEYSVFFDNAIEAYFPNHSRRYAVATLNEALLTGSSFAMLPYERREVIP